MISLPPDTVAVWLARPSEATAELLARYESLLSPEEAERAHRFRFDVHRREFLVTRALVRETLSRYHPRSPEAWQFERSEYGRPAEIPRVGLSFNLSNTVDLVACAVTKGRELGLDVEPFSRWREVVEVSSTVLSPEELAELVHLAAADPTAHAIRAIDLWTCKEAYMKARGLGMSLPPTAFALSFDPSGDIRVAPAPHWRDARSWTFSRLKHAEHRIALCVETTGREGAALRIETQEVVPLRGAATT